MRQEIGTNKEVEDALEYLRNQDWFEETWAKRDTAKTINFLGELARGLSYKTQWHSIHNPREAQVVFEPSTVRREDGFSTKRFDAIWKAYIAGLAEAVRRMEEFSQD